MKKLVTLVALCTVLFTFPSSSAAAKTTTSTGFDVPAVSSAEPQPDPGFIYVKTRIKLAAVLIPVQVFFTDPVLSVKQDIASVLNIPVDSFELTFNGVVLDEELPLNAYGITTRSILGVHYL